MPERCGWADNAPEIYKRYHDEEWGVPLHEESKLFEMLILESFQAGLSWILILKKREAFREAFDGFCAEKIAAYGPEKLASLLENPGIIRNRRKLEATIQNAKAYLGLCQEKGSLDAYLWDWVGNRQIIVPQEPFMDRSPLSDALAKDLKKRGFRFLGSVTVYSFLQAVGLLDCHEDRCFRRRHCVPGASASPES